MLFVGGMARHPTHSNALDTHSISMLCTCLAYSPGIGGVDPFIFGHHY